MSHDTLSNLINIKSFMNRRGLDDKATDDDSNWTRFSRGRWF